MGSLNLMIAGYIIRLRTTPDGPALVISNRFKNFTTENDLKGTVINVRHGSCLTPDGAIRVFSAPFIEEINGVMVKKSDEFWDVYTSGDDLHITCTHPLSENMKRSMLRISPHGEPWEMVIEDGGQSTDPLEYPMDGLLLYYLTAFSGDMFIHASGVSINGHGYLFSGISGTGKSTMARIFGEAGAQVVHDDRLIIRKTRSGYFMFNTPVYDNETPLFVRLDKIFLIGHGTENMISKVSGAAAVSLLMANCIQHNYDPSIVGRLLKSVSDLCESLPVARLGFVPDNKIVDYILSNER